MGAGVVQKSGGGRRGRRRGRRSAAMAEINITPFVDVMLVLLIIFMVAAPLTVVGVPIEMPKTAASALSTDREEPLTVTITADGRVMLQKTEVARDDLIAKLKAISAERESDKVFLRADGAIAYKQVVTIMGALTAAGFTNIGLVTDSGGPTLDGQGN